MNSKEELKHLEDFKKQVEESTHHFRKAKETAKRINSYIKGDQLPDEVRQILLEREQPEMWENIFKKIDAKIKKKI